MKVLSAFHSIKSFLLGSKQTQLGSNIMRLVPEYKRLPNRNPRSTAGLRSATEHSSD